MRTICEIQNSHSVGNPAIVIKQYLERSKKLKWRSVLNRN